MSGRAWFKPLGPGDWNAHQVVGHLFDVDIVYGFRWCLALTVDLPAHPGHDERAWGSPEAPVRWRRTRPRHRPVRSRRHPARNGPDPATLARIEREGRYRRDRDEVALGETMQKLDREETEAQATNADLPTAAEAVEYFRDLLRLWDEAEGSGCQQLAEALFDRIDVLGAQRLQVHPSAAARAQGWADAWRGVRLLVVMVGARGVGPAEPTSCAAAQVLRLYARGRRATLLETKAHRDAADDYVPASSRRREGQRVL